MKSFNYAVLSSLCALIIGLLLVVWPGQAIIYLVLTIGVLFLLPGLFGLVSYVMTARKRREAGYGSPFPIVALGSTLFGILCRSQSVGQPGGGPLVGACTLGSLHRAAACIGCRNGRAVRPFHRCRGTVHDFGMFFHRLCLDGFVPPV